MKTSHHDKQHNAMRVNQSAESRKSAADIFRRRHIDSALKRLLQSHEKTQTIYDDSSSAESHGTTEASTP